MQNFINRDLAEFRGIPDEDIESLNRMHFLMDSLKLRYMLDMRVAHEEPVPECVQLLYLQACEWLEFEMQKLWGFPLEADRHTHCKFFKAAAGGTYE